MGSNPHNFINQTRITRACTMLQTTDEAILNIAEAVGLYVGVQFQPLLPADDRGHATPVPQPGKTGAQAAAAAEHRAVPRLGSAGSLGCFIGLEGAPPGEINKRGHQADKLRRSVELYQKKKDFRLSWKIIRYSRNKRANRRPLLEMMRTANPVTRTIVEL